jgi:hypothetical protein
VKGVGGHELVRIYEVGSADSAFYANDEHPRRDGIQSRVQWKPIEDLTGERLYPHGLNELLSE